jgi:hypothetical protein
MALSPVFSAQRTRSVGLAAVLLLCAGSCGGRSSVSAGDGEVVARVNETPITRREIERLGQRSLGELALPSVERRAFTRLVDAAVQSRALALASERELGPEEKRELDEEVAAYREQLLIRRYVTRHHPPKPVTQAMIAEYYQAHPDRFGGGTERSYELISATRGLSSEERLRLLEKLHGAAQRTDWRAFAGELTSGGYPVAYATAAENDKLLHPKIRELVRSLASGRTSEVAFFEGRVHIARAGAETARPPRPLAAVAPEIERLLAPVQFSAAIQRAANAVLPSTKVELLGGAPSGSVAARGALGGPR